MFFVHGLNILESSMAMIFVRNFIIYGHGTVNVLNEFFPVF